MGCDIHVYVEHSANGKYWRSLISNGGSRNYRMFGILAGVRCGDVKIFDPKGMPSGELSRDAENHYWVNIAPENRPEWVDLEGWTSRENAERWLAGGSSKPDYHDGNLHRVTHPDWHSHSWLTTSELAQCVDEYRNLSEDSKAPTEWVAILAAMQAIEANGDMARVVFWFDN